MGLGLSRQSLCGRFAGSMLASFEDCSSTGSGVASIARI